MRFQPSTHHLGALDGYGYSAETGWPTIKVTATDVASNGAVSTLAKKLRSETYEGKNERVLDDVIGGVTNPKNKGVFTPGMDSQVKKFQAAKGLQADGIVGPKTWNSLGQKSATPAPGRSAPVAEPKKEEPQIVETGITDKVWFWPAVALVGVGGVTTGVIVWKRRRASAS